MKTTYSVNGKKTSKSAVIKMIGKEKHDRMLKEAQETFMEDPWIENDFFTSIGILNISFEW